MERSKLMAPSQPIIPAVALLQTPRPRILKPYDSTLKSYIRQLQPHEPVFELCDVCRSIDFAAIEAIDCDGLRMNSGLVFFYLEHIKQLNSCLLCRLFRKRLEDDGSIFEKSKPYALYHHRDTNASSHRDLHSLLRIGEFPPRMNRENGVILDALIYLRIELFETPKLPTHWLDERERSKGNLYADYDWIRQSVESCVHTHHSCRFDSLVPTAPRLKLIDCMASALSLKVVVAQPGEEYVALSYVWVHKKGFAKDETGTLVESPPQCIIDTVMVTRKLGKRYLWIDCYCIDQTNELEKLQQIALMGAIYENTWATIVGVGASKGEEKDGIYSVGSLYEPSPNVYIPQGRIRWPDKMVDIRGCKWSQRAWTFQEAVLSRRLIIFLPTWTLFACREDEKLFPEPFHRLTAVEACWRSLV